MDALPLPPDHPPFEDPLAFVAHPAGRQGLPAHLFEQAQQYFNRRQRPGEAIMALLEGDSDRARAHATPADRPHLRQLHDVVTHYAESEAHGSPERVARYLADRSGGHIPVADLAVALQLAALYNAAAPVGYGVHQYRSAPATEATARDWIDACGSPETRHGKRAWHFDYVHGRRMKIVLGTPWLDPRGYDSEHGTGTAARTIGLLRYTGDPAAPAILLEHHIDLTARASLGGVTLDTALDDPELTTRGLAMLMSLRESADAMAAGNEGDED